MEDFSGCVSASSSAILSYKSVNINNIFFKARRRDVSKNHLSFKSSLILGKMDKLAFLEAQKFLSGNLKCKDSTWE